MIDVHGKMFVKCQTHDRLVFFSPKTARIESEHHVRGSVSFCSSFFFGTFLDLYS